MFPKVVSKIEHDISLKSDSEMIALLYEELKPTTRASFQREIRRFMCWLHSQDSRLQLKDVTFIHVKVYRDMLTDIPEQAISSKTVKYNSNKFPDGINPEWRPFKKKSLALKSIRTAMHILSSFGHWLVQREYLPANPFMLVEKVSISSKEAAKQSLEKDVDTSKHFTTNEMDWILYAIDDLIKYSAPSKNIKRLHFWKRFKFIFIFLRRTALRREEMVEVLWKYIEREVRDDGAEMYVLRGIGKGDKVFTIPLHYDAYEALQNYKQLLIEQNLNTPSYQVSGEILKNRAGKKRITSKTLHCDIKEAFGCLADHIIENHKAWDVNQENLVDFNSLAKDRLKKASAHWLRHSAITESASKFSNMKSLQEYARHSDINTTGIYWHTENSELHREINSDA